MKERLRDNIKSLILYFERKISSTVSTKIMIPFFLVTLIVIASISGLVLAKINEQIKDMENRRAVSILAAIKQRFQEEQMVIENYTRLLAYSGELHEAVLRKDQGKIYQLLIPVKQYSNQQQLLVFDTEGKLLVHLSSVAVKNLDEINIERSRHGLVESDFRVNREGLNIYAAAPINDDLLDNHDIPQGVLVISKHIGDHELMSIKRRENVEINVVVDDKIVASTLNNTDREKFTLLINNSRGEFASIVLEDKREFVNTWENLGNNAYISVMIPNEDLAVLNLEITKTIVTITVFAAILVLFSSIFLAKLMVGPLRNMVSITRAITHGDFTKRIEILTKDEFGQLGESINYMAERIKERIDEAEHLATIDGLTGLYNHRFFQQRLTEELNRAQRLRSPLSLVFIDIDYFKHYNDNMGHPAGDRVLQQLGQILRTNIRGIDIAARYGGEEFAVILADAAAPQALDVSERIRKAVEEFPFQGKGTQPGANVTISVGIASYPENAVTKDELIKLADDALYKAKHLSKNRVVLYYSVLDELKSDMDQSENDLLNTVKTLISVINSRDKYTYGHSERVVHYATAVAVEVGVSTEELRVIKVGAYLHDIGKIEISRDLLNKSTPLNDEEIEIFKQHPVWGAEIASPVKVLQDVLPAILYHHENYDGTGYPNGLAGTDIPLAARILRIADSFDAMTSIRPYQDIKTVEEAKKELLRSAGGEFDPLLVQAFIRCLEEGDMYGKMVAQ